MDVMGELSGAVAPRASGEFVHELKFYLSTGEAAVLAAWARRHLAADPHGSGPEADSYRVSSLYFDTRALDALSRQGSYARSRYRVRRYDDAELVYLERKTNAQRRVYKRRSATALQALSRLEAAASERDWSGFWFDRRLRLRGLRPVCRIDYRRMARVGCSAYGPVRLTLDSELRAWRAADLRSWRADTDATLGAGTVLSPQRLILELKFGSELPALFRQLVREFAPEPRRISKYRLACQQLGLFNASPVPISGEPACAPG